jgi:arylsulfatase A-like enzyme
MPAGEVTIAELARARGYATGLVGKWHLGFVPGCEPNDQGFDEFFGHHAGCIDYYSHLYYWTGSQDPPSHDLYRNRTEVHEEGQYMTELVAREAVRFVEARGRPAGARPFLLYVPFNAPHFPMHAPQRFREMYANLPPQRAIYAAMVAALDDAIGRILAALDRAGLADETLVFFASDNGATVEPEANHGGGNNGPYRGHKFSVLEGGIHIPALVCWPGHVPAGAVRDQLVCAIDLLPTLAEAIDAPLPADRTIDGLSWLALLKDPRAAGHDVLCWREGKQYAIRQGRWKLLFRAIDTSPRRLNVEMAPEDRVFLVDLQADPGERHNLATAHPEIVHRLTELHAKWELDVKSGH